MCSERRLESLQLQGMLYALTWQLIQAKPWLAAVVQTDYIFPCKSANIRTLKQLFTQVLSAFPSVRVVLDGLDECEKKQQEDMLSCLTMMTGGDKSSSICKVLVSSQDVLATPRQLKTKACLNLSDERLAVEEAIRSYVHAQVKQSPLFAEAEAEHMVDMAYVEQTLVGKAGGLFFIRLFIDH